MYRCFNGEPAPLLDTISANHRARGHGQSAEKAECDLPLIERSGAA